MSEVPDRVKRIIASYLDLDEAALQPGTSFAEDLNMDSLSVMELIIALEEEFSVEFDQESVSSVATVGDAIKAVEAALP
ncbi:acyl carrier protein [Rhizobium sp. YIM 134829]|uniref:acyl carrier protein n=1 Tax=Rhizobium sp. YIM 134829 TaxID=3390453 RepID=UPI00397C496E